MLTQLLFEPVTLPTRRGRIVKFDVDELDIMVATGTMEERIEILMRHRGYPMSAREIAAGVGSNASQVNRGLRHLVTKGQVEVIEMPGCVREYALKAS